MRSIVEDQLRSLESDRASDRKRREPSWRRKSAPKSRNRSRGGRGPVEEHRRQHQATEDERAVRLERNVDALLVGEPAMAKVRLRGREEEDVTCH